MDKWSEYGGLNLESTAILGRQCTPYAVASVIVLCIAGGILFGPVWIHLIKHPKLDDVHVYQNETVILGEVDPFYHGQVTIRSDHIPLG